jgi:isopentenyl-diphosphate delta-isomerase
MKKQELVVLVDRDGNNLCLQDGKLSVMGKMEAHQKGMLHRAISVFIFDDSDRLLIQKRTSGKFHSPSLWSNTCCTHPLPGESTLAAAQRCLREELGIDALIKESFTFLYRAEVGNGLIEYEFDHVFLGISNQDPNPNPVEVSDWYWITMDDLDQTLVSEPEKYTPWLRSSFNTIVKQRLRRNPF